MPKQPVRIFEGETRPHEPFWRWRNAVEQDGAEPELEFYGFISEYSWWDDDITPQLFKDQLYSNGQGGPVTIRMNSGGGDMIAASVIRSTIMEYPGKVTVRIDGLAASAATYVAMAGDLVRMQDTAYFMIHDPWTIAIGNVDDLKQVIDMLKSLKSGIVDAYASKTKLPAEKLAKLMNDETWMSANEAKTLGFVDEVITASSKKSAPQATYVNALPQYYVNVPAALLKREPVNPIEAESPDVVKLRAEVCLLKGTK
jgi:ATP-dependent Clp protease protease subunit